MPRGDGGIRFQKGHAKVGGRKKGTTNKAVAMRQRVEEFKALAVETGGPRKRLGVEILSKFANDFFQYAIYFEARARRFKGKARAKAWGEYVNLSKLAMDAAGAVAKYESPSFRAIAVVPQQPEPANQNTGPDNNVIPLNDAVAAARVYRRIVTASRSA